MKLTWKDVFNSDHRHWGWVGTAFDAAREAGYSYFSWNGCVYSCTGFTKEKVCLVSDLT